MTENGADNGMYMSQPTGRPKLPTKGSFAKYSGHQRPLVVGADSEKPRLPMHGDAPYFCENYDPNHRARVEAFRRGELLIHPSSLEWTIMGAASVLQDEQDRMFGVMPWHGHLR